VSATCVAPLADLHRNYVGGVERGERNVSLLNIVKIARGLNISPVKLLDRIHLGHTEKHGPAKAASCTNHNPETLNPHLPI
jgi:transcriptional regulator with XRE-family HTH domain